MATVFPSIEFFTRLQDAMNADLDGTSHLEPCDAYCGMAIGTHLFVLEFDGRACSAVVPGGNELDLDFVLAGSSTAWEKLFTAQKEAGAAGALGDLVGDGVFELRSADDDMLPAARDALPFLEVFFSRAAGMELVLGPGTAAWGMPIEGPPAARSGLSETCVT